MYVHLDAVGAAMSERSERAPAPLIRHSVILIDGELAMHDLARRILEAEPRLRFVGGSLSLAAGLQLAAEVGPDAVLLDPELAEPPESVPVAEIQRAAPLARIVLFSETIPDPVPVGVDAAITKWDAPALLDAVRAALGLSRPVELAERCPACTGTLLMTGVLLREEMREVVCSSCLRVYLQDATELTELGVLE